MANKIVKRKTGGESPKLKQAVKDSTVARKAYDTEYNRTVKHPTAKPNSEYLESKQEIMDRPAKIRLENKKTGGAVKAKRKK